MTLKSASPIALLTSLFMGTPIVAHGQTSTETSLHCEAYADCALRVQHGLFATRIVRGTESTDVARIGLGTPPLGQLFARSDLSATDFDRFSEDHIRSSWLAVLGGIGFVGGLIAGARGDEDWATAFTIGGTVFEVGAGIFRNKATEHLSEAIWWYNESLTRQGAR